MAFFSALWTKIKTVCLGSVTMAWSYIVTTTGMIFSNIDALATVLGDPNLNSQISSVIGDAKAVGKWLLAVGIITSIARLKTLVTTKNPPGP